MRRVPRAEDPKTVNSSSLDGRTPNSLKDLANKVKIFRHS